MQMEHPGGERGENKPPASAQPSEARPLVKIWESLVHLGLGEPFVRAATGAASLLLCLVVVWVMANFYITGKAEKAAQPSTAAQAVGQAALTGAGGPAEPTVSPLAVMPDFLASTGPQGILRAPLLHTILPSRSRYEVIQYTVVKGDSIFAIAEKFSLRPETILWGNLYTLGDNPHLLQPDVVLNILPVDGVYHKWSAGEGLNGVAKYYGVTPEDIVNWPGNHLSMDTIGDLAHPNIPADTWLVVPGGEREFSSWATPRITRTNPASAKILGAGYCGTIVDGIIGDGVFIFPTVAHYLSGFDYSPSTNHFGLDFDGELGTPVYASDHGVVVYAGWNDYGYGNVVVLDHGNGWQTLYAHLSSYSVSCGLSVYKGSVIGGVGSTGNSTGPHLHFEMRSDQYGKVNPWDFLQ